MNEPVVAWHFCKADRKLGYGDGREVKSGAIFTVNPDELALCQFGLHGSVRAIDALSFARGGVVSRTVHSGEIIYGRAKLASSVREHIVVADAVAVLLRFIEWCAERVSAANYTAAAYSANYAAYAANYATYAAYAVANAAAYSANAERTAQNEKLESMLFELIQKQQGLDEPIAGPRT